jgi:hypothetical protein
MKMNILIIAVAGIGLALTSSRISADTIKGGERLAQWNASAVPTAAPADYKPMACEKCKDVTSIVADTTAKGGLVLETHGTPVKAMTVHGCNECATTAKLVQAGKSSPAAGYAHTCSACGSENMAGCDMKAGQP